MTNEEKILGRVSEFIFEEEKLDVTIPCLLVGLREIMKMIYFYQGQEQLEDYVNFLISKLPDSDYPIDVKENLPRFLMASKIIVDSQFE